MNKSLDARIIAVFTRVYAIFREMREKMYNIFAINFNYLYSRTYIYITYGVNTTTTLLPLPSPPPQAVCKLNCTRNLVLLSAHGLFFLFFFFTTRITSHTSITYVIYSRTISLIRPPAAQHLPDRSPWFSFIANNVHRTDHFSSASVKCLTRFQVPFACIIIK